VKNTVRFIRFIGRYSGWGACAIDARHFVNGLNGLATGNPKAGGEIGESIEALGGCVGDLLREMLLDEVKE
jgi:hypothetical protein